MPTQGLKGRENVSTYVSTQGKTRRDKCLNLFKRQIKSQEREKKIFSKICDLLDIPEKSHTSPTIFGKQSCILICKKIEEKIENLLVCTLLQW